MVVVAGNALVTTRIMENFLGKPIKEATFSSPIRLVGFSKMPAIGSVFNSFEKKNEAEESIKDFLNKKTSPQEKNSGINDSNKKLIPIVIKADVSGSIEAIEKEIEKIKTENAEFKIVQKGAGPISETDIKAVASSAGDALVIGFNVKADKNAIELAEKQGITISFFDVIYKMTEWLAEEMEKRRPRIQTTEITGRAKIIKTFSRKKERQIIGGKVIEGHISLNGIVKIVRREFEIGTGKIVNLEKGKTKTSEVEEGTEFGMMLESKIEATAGDSIEAFSIIQK